MREVRYDLTKSWWRRFGEAIGSKKMGQTSETIGPRSM